MTDDLLPYYERELSYFRTAARDFGQAYGSVARQLLLEPDKCDDPHVERLIEAFAFIAGRIQHKIDDEFPEITESLLGVLYPHYLRPVPSFSIAQFSIDPEQAKNKDGYTLAALKPVFSQFIPGRNTSCSFRTCYPVTLWPLAVEGAGFRAAAAANDIGLNAATAWVLRIDLKCKGGTDLAGLNIASLRFYLDGEPSITHILYELLFTKIVGVSIQIPGAGSRKRTVALPRNCVEPVGFGRSEGTIPYPDRSFLGYRLLQEYFAFEQKFLFFDVTGLSAVDSRGSGDSFSLFIEFGGGERRQRFQQLERDAGAENLKLGCTPIVNLFQRSAEPIRITHTKTEYPVIPDIHRQAYTEVHSIDRVVSAVPYLDKTEREYAPFYSTRHQEGQAASAFWYATRRGTKNPLENGTDVFLTLVNGRFGPAELPEETLSVTVTCTNRDLASELPSVGKAGELVLESGALVKARLLMKPTKPVRPPQARGLQWRLISHLSLNHLSLVSDGREALQEILRLYDHTEDPDIRKRIAGISALSSGSTITRVISPHGVVFAQGTRVNLELDEDAFVGTGSFLFGAVLERFFGLYSALNSFSQTVLTTQQRKEVVKKWAPRSGEQILL